MATAKKLASGSWSIQVYVGRDSRGARRYKRFRDETKKGCERKAALYLAEHQDYREEGQLTFAKALEEYLDLRRPVLSPATIRGYRNVHKMLTEKYPSFCRLRLEQIDGKALQRLVNDFVLKEDLSPKSIKNRYGLISATLKQNGFQPPTVKLPEREKIERHMPTDAEIRALLDACAGFQVEIPVKLALFGGMRRGEISALTMDDLNGDTLTIRAALVVDEDKNIVRKGPKTLSSYRKVQIPHELAEEIRERGVICPFRSPHGVTSAFERAVKRAGLNGLRFHDLRHWHASYLHSLGLSDMEIQARGGWSSNFVLRNVYLHELPDAERENTRRALADMERFFK